MDDPPDVQRGRVRELLRIQPFGACVHYVRSFSYQGRRCGPPTIDIGNFLAQRGAHVDLVLLSPDQHSKFKFV
jgi:hypothetical protein